MADGELFGQRLSELMRSSSEPYWVGVREVLAVAGLDVEQALLTRRFQDDARDRLWLTVPGGGVLYELVYSPEAADPADRGRMVELQRGSPEWRRALSALRVATVQSSEDGDPDIVGGVYVAVDRDFGKVVFVGASSDMPRWIWWWQRQGRVFADPRFRLIWIAKSDDPVMRRGIEQKAVITYGTRRDLAKDVRLVVGEREARLVIGEGEGIGADVKDGR